MKNELKSSYESVAFLLILIGIIIGGYSTYNELSIYHVILKIIQQEYFLICLLLSAGIIFYYEVSSIYTNYLITIRIREKKEISRYIKRKILKVNNVSLINLIILLLAFGLYFCYGKFNYFIDGYILCIIQILLHLIWIYLFINLFEFFAIEIIIMKQKDSLKFVFIPVLIFCLFILFTPTMYIEKSFQFIPIFLWCFSSNVIFKNDLIKNLILLVHFILLFTIYIGITKKINKYQLNN